MLADSAARWTALNEYRGRPFDVSERQPPSAFNLFKGGAFSVEAMTLLPSLNWWQLAQPTEANRVRPFSTRAGSTSRESSSFLTGRLRSRAAAETATRSPRLC